MMKMAEDYRQGSSLNQLVQKFRIPKSTIYYHLNKLCAIRKIEKVKHLKNNDEFRMGTFIGLWAGDGSRYKDTAYRLKIHFGKNDLAKILLARDLTRFIFGREGFISKDGEGSISIKFSSKFIHDFPERYLLFDEGEPHAKSRSVRLKVLNHPSVFLKGFLLGIALSDGHFGRVYVYSTVSKNLAGQVLEIMKGFGFNPTLRREERTNKNWNQIFRIVLNRQESLKFSNFAKSLIREKLANGSGLNGPGLEFRRTHHFPG